MINEFGLDTKEDEALSSAQEALTLFSATFGKPPRATLLSELLVVSKLNLKIAGTTNQSGYDAFDSRSQRYQIKYMANNTLNIDVNNFDFDVLILVHFDNSFQLAGMWKLPVIQAQEIFKYRPNFLNFPGNSKSVKLNADKIWWSGF